MDNAPRLINCFGVVMGLAGCLAIFFQVMFAGVPASERWPLYLSLGGFTLIAISIVLDYQLSRL